MNRDIWGVFHDGTVTSIDGALPGTVRLEIEIAYLRRLFDEPGDTFIIELGGCRSVRFIEFGEPATEDLARIQAREPEVLYVESEVPLVLDCATGKLELDYDIMQVRLPSGAAVSYSDLASASERYWTTWRERTEG